MILNLYKERGETPLECIQHFVAQNPDLKGQKMTYLGRLDPLAEGVLLVASEEDVHRKQEFLGLDKEYDFVSIFGFATDTYDVMGKVLKVEEVKDLNELDLIKLAKVYEGDREQKYPFYSSKSISSRKSFSSESPRVFPQSGVRRSPENFSSKKITIHKLEFCGLDTLLPKELFGRILMDISRVKGDFRQDEILELWKDILTKESGTKYLAKWRAHVSSGTYIRSLVNDIGNSLGFGATTLSIKRTRVGDYKIKDSLL